GVQKFSGAVGIDAYAGDLRYRLDSGKSPRTEVGTCSATSDAKGICGVSTLGDSNYDSLTALKYQQPTYAMAASYGSVPGTMPSFIWSGQSSVSSPTLTVQAYNHNTSAWTTVTPSITTCSGIAANTNCGIRWTPSGTIAHYFSVADAFGKYWISTRIIMTES